MSFLWSFGSSSKKEPATGGSPVATGAAPDFQHQQQQTFKTMSTAFRRGVTYNMKIVLRGDVMTGKSTLFNRLQGAEFEEVYNSTPEIQVANIPWQYKDSNDIIKVEVWDVVDKAHNKPSSKLDTGIKLEHNAPSKQQQPQETASSEGQELGLDASTVNVYRNTHAALFIFDVTKQWTFDYVNNELANVPEGVSILVLGNFSDKSAERVVSLEMIHATLYQHNQQRIENNAIKPNLIRYAETSMKTGLGLQYIYDYLAVPFLQLQMESFKKQLELKATEIVDMLENLDTSDKVPEIMRRRRGQDNFDQPTEPHLARQHEELKNAWDQELEDIATDNPTTLEVPSPPSFVRKETPPPPTAPVRGRRREGSLVSDSDRMPAAVDQFDAGELADDWFGDDTGGDASFGITAKKQDSDNDDYGGNPMVAGDEDVEPVEYYNTGKSSHSTTTAHQASTENQQSSDEEEETQPHVDREEEEEEEDVNPYGPPTVFRSELSEVWSSTSMIHDSQHHSRTGHTLLMGKTRIESDSEDEDNVFIPTPLTEDVHSSTPDASSGSPFMTSSGFGGYEEIGGDNDNPWSWDDQKQQKEQKEQQTKEESDFWAETKEDELQEMAIPQPHVESIEETTKASEKSKGKKKATSSTTKKKKSKDGSKKKKKKSTTTSP